MRKTVFKNRPVPRLTFLMMLISLLATSLVYGQTWTSVTSGTTTDLNDAFFVNSNEGWVVGESGLIRHTDDGGDTWSTQGSGVTSESLRGVYFVNSNEGWVSGNGGTMLHTTDGGDNWSSQSVAGTTVRLYTPTFINANEGWVSGNDDPPNTTEIFHTTNGGDNWSAGTTGTIRPIHDNFFIDADEGWAVGSNDTILHTTNGGTTWSEQTSGTTEHLSGVVFDGEDTMWVVGDTGTIRNYTDFSLPVELSAFMARQDTSGVRLRWRTESETNNVGFNIYRSRTENGESTRIGWVIGTGSTASAHEYQFIDQTAEPDQAYFYYLEDVDLEGNREKLHWSR